MLENIALTQFYLKEPERRPRVLAPKERDTRSPEFEGETLAGWQSRCRIRDSSGLRARRNVCGDR